MQVSNSMVRMHPGSYITLKGYMGTGNYSGAYVGGNLFGTNSTFTGMLITQFWEGIVTMRGATNSSDPFFDRFKGSYVSLNNCKIERARNAITNYNYIDVPAYPVQTSGGSMDVRFSTFRNNIRSLRLNNDHYSDGEIGIGDDPNSSDGLNWNLLFQYDDFIIDANFSPSTINIPVENPTEMVSAISCNSVSFLSCRFLSSNNNYGKNMTGIFGANSGIKVQRYFYNPNAQRGEFKGFGTGIALYNNLEVNRVPVILNCDFDCQNDINLFSCFNSFILNNKFLKTFADSKYPSTSINLYRSTGYKVEGNTITAPSSGVTAFASGIVVNGSGVAYNEIYRNSFTEPTSQYNGLAIGIQSIGRNRNDISNGTSGLKLLCNDIKTNYYKGRDISVMKDYSSSPLLYHGIHKTQYLQAIPNRSAGNTFITAVNPSNITRNYYVEPGTNNLGGIFPFKYGYNLPQQLIEKPINSNLGTINLIDNFAPKSCAVKSNAAMPPSRYNFNTFKVNLIAIEKKMTTLEAQTTTWNATDSANMEMWMISQSDLIDSIVSYYQFRNLTDSIAMVYEQATKGYQYKLYQASAYKDLNRFDDAINLLNQLPQQFLLDEISTDEVVHLATLYTTLQWLAANEYNWIGMPESYKNPVYDYEYDPTSAGGVAISLLATYEGRRYEPWYIEQEGDNIAMNSKIATSNNERIYPNPTNNNLQVNWTQSALFIMTDISGRTVLHQKIDIGINSFNISALKPGLYFALIKEGNKTVYQQKIIKQ